MLWQKFANETSLNPLKAALGSISHEALAPSHGVEMMQSISKRVNVLPAHVFDYNQVAIIFESNLNDEALKLVTGNLPVWPQDAESNCDEKS